MAKRKKTQPEKPVHGYSTLVESLELTEEVGEVIEAGFSQCSKSQVEKALDGLIPHLLTRLTPNCELDTAIVPTALSFLKTLDSWEAYGKRHNVQTLFLLISGLVSDETIESVWRSHMVQLITKFVQSTHYNEHSKAALALLQYLFHVVIEPGDKPVTAADIKRIKDLKPFILNIDLLEPSMTPILNYFMKAIISEDFLKLKEGVVVLAYFLSREATLVKKMQSTIRDNLANLSRKVAAHYGEVYFHAWILAEDGSEVKKEIEQRCIQDIMLRTMTLKRNGLSMGPIGSLCFAILKTLRANRRLTKFSRLITDLYEPILWRSLKDSNAVVRCNAAQVFFDVFPLEKGSGAYENCQFRDKQVKEIKDLLLDECHLVRIISIEGTGTIFTSGASSVLSVEDIKEIMKIVATKLVYDVSDFRVRRAVFSMFETLVADTDARKLVMPLIKMSHLKMKIHDEHELVRKAVVKVLLRLKEVNDPDAQFWEVVDLKHLLARLQEEGPVVGELLVKLMFEYVYKEGQDVSKTLNNLVKTVKICPDALMKLFKYSKKVASTYDSFCIIVTVLAAMKKWIKERQAVVAAEAENPPASSSSQHSRKKPSKKAKVLKDVTNSGDCGTDDNDSTSGSSSSEEPVQEETTNRKKGSPLDNHEIISALLNGVSVLWAVNSHDLEEKGHTNVMNDLACSLIPSLLLYYKGQRVYYAVVSFASLIPIRVLSANCTITGAIMAELREMDENADQEVLNCLIMAMNLWGRTEDIVELATEWLNHAFKHEDLNSTLVPRPHKKKRSAKVRFEAAGGKPLLAVKFLDMLFNHVACVHHLLSKKYDMLYDFFLYLERIKKLIERRLENGKEFEEQDLSDTFLKSCLTVYLDLIILLHRPDQPPEDVSFTSDFEGPQALSEAVKSAEIMNWAHRVLIPHVRGEVNDQFNFAADCLEHIMKRVAISLDTSRTDKEHVLLTMLFVDRLLEVENASRFMEMAFDVQRAVLEYCAAYRREDEWQVFSSYAPAVLKNCLDVLGTMDPGAEDFKELAKDTKKFKENVIVPFKIYKTMYGATDKRFLDVCSMYLELSLELEAKLIEQNERMEIYCSLNDHPLILSLIVKYLLTAKIPVILPWLQAYMAENREDAASVFAGTSLLSTLALSCKSHFDSAHLEQCLSNCFQLIRALPEDFEEAATSAEELLLQVGRDSGCAIQTRE